MVMVECFCLETSNEHEKRSLGRRRCDRTAFDRARMHRCLCPSHNWSSVESSSPFAPLEPAQKWLNKKVATVLRPRYRLLCDSEAMRCGVFECDRISHLSRKANVHLKCLIRIQASNESQIRLTENFLLPSLLWRHDSPTNWFTSEVRASHAATVERSLFIAPLHSPSSHSSGACLWLPVWEGHL